MDRRFERIFQEQMELYRAGQLYLDFLPSSGPRRSTGGVLRSLAVVDAAIDAGVARAAGGKELRSDARVVLLTNLHQMVALPLSHPDSPTPPDVLEEGQLARDVQSIVTAAIENSKSDRVSAADILRATALILEQLNLKSWRLWDSND